MKKYYNFKINKIFEKSIINLKMVETEDDTYNMNSSERKQSLKVSLINNTKVSMVITDKETQQRYSSLLSLPKLKKLSKAFLTIKKAKDALNIIKEGIESGKIMLSEDPNDNTIEIKYNLKNFPPFDIKLKMEEPPQENEIEQDVLPPKFDYKGNVEAEAKYGHSTENTTEFNKPNIQTNVKDPIMQLEYIEPILQVHYPDGTTKTTKLPPRIQGINGQMPNITDEQFRLIREQMDRNVGYKGLSPLKDDSNYYRSNSAVKGKMSQYSTRTSPNITNNNLFLINQSNNFVQPTFQSNQIDPNDLYNRMNYKINSDYNTQSVENKHFLVGNTNYGQFQNQTLPNSFYDNKTLPANIGMKHRKFKKKPGDRASSTPSNQNKYPIRKKKNMPCDRNLKTEKLNKKGPQDKIDKKQNSKENKTHKKKKSTKTEKLQQQIKQNTTYTKQNLPPQFLQNQTSNEIGQVKAHLFANPQNTQYQKMSSYIEGQTPSLANNDPYSQISQQQIALAQLASRQNEENPEFKNLQAITLEQKIEENNIPQNFEQNVQIQNEIQEPEQVQEVQEIEQNQGQNIHPEIEDLFITEEGKVIFRNGLLRGIIHTYSEIDDVVTKIQDILLKGAKFNLVYKAFDLDDKAKTFHEKCDKLDMSLVLIETDKDIRFGGFTTQSWAGTNQKKKDNNAFVFSLETNKIFEIFPDEPAIGCYPKFGPVFFGCQIRIYDQFFSKGGTTCHKGLNYNTDEDYELNNGEQKYLIKDIEIYKIDTIDI